MTVIEISECFPNKQKQITGEFIMQHVKSLSRHCRVITIVPLRYVPGRELFTYNVIKLFSNIKKWYAGLSENKNFSSNNLDIIYFRYISLPRPYFELIDVHFVNFFFFRSLKNILTKENPDIIYCNWIKPWGKLAYKLSQNFNIPLVIDHHETIFTLKKLFPVKYKRFLKIFEKADCIIVHSSSNKTELTEVSNTLNLKLNQINTVYLGQNFLINPESKQFHSDCLNIVCVSHLHETSKKIDILIKALALVKTKLSFYLKIVGDGILKDKYMNITDSLLLNLQIKFFGGKSPNEVEEILNDSDVFILPSYPESFGVVFIEALAKGLPVITCEGNGGGEELKRLGYPVILVKPDSPEELADAILKLSKDKTMMSGMSAKGKDIVKKYFTWENNAEATFSLLNKTIEKFKRIK